MSENAQYPQVELPNIEKLKLSVEKGIARISFQVTTPGPGILKLMYLQANAQPLNVVFESPQAEMDLQLIPVSLKTGEIKENV